MPKFLEDKLKAEAAKKGYTGDRADAYTYGTLNNLGAMHGSKETAKGRAMDAKHAADSKKGGHKQSAQKEALHAMLHSRRNNRD